MATTASPHLPTLNRALTEPLRGARLVAGRSVWVLIACLALIVLVVGLSGTYHGYSHSCTTPLKLETCELLGRLRLTFLAREGLALYTVTAISLMAVLWTVMGWLIFLRSPVSAASLLMSLGLVTGWATDLTGYHMGYAFSVTVLRHPDLMPLGLACTYVIGVTAQVSVVAMILMLPDGLFKPRWTALLVLLWSVYVPLNTLYHYPFDLFPGSLSLEVLEEILVLAVPMALIVAVWLRYRSATETARAQLRTLLPSARAFIVVYAGFAFWMLLIYPPNTVGQNTLQFATDFIQVGVQSALGAWFGVAIGTAILRHNLFATDLFVSRALVYGSLSGALLLLYLGVVFGVGGLLGLSGTPWFPLVATALVLTLFEPLRTLLTRRVERALYGVREPPFRAFVGLSRQLQDLVPDDYFPNLVQTVARWFRLPFVRLSVATGAFRTEAHVGTLQGEAVRFPVVSQGERLGLLEVAVRPGEVLTAEERNVLETIAGQLGVSLRSLATTAELQVVRERLVSTREAERRRLQRDLHDGLGPALAAQALVAGSARDLLTSDPDGAGRLLERLERDLHGTLDGVRRLVYSLSPSDLEQLGLCGALRLKTAALVGKGLKLELIFPAALSPLSAAAESAAYHIVTEAVTNVVRHARAKSCRVELREVVGRLELSVCDDGLGLSAKRRGVGLLSIKERAEELGGRFAVTSGPTGTRVWASLPLSGPAETH